MADGTLKVGTITTSSGSGTITLGQSGETIDMLHGTVTLNSSMKQLLLFKHTHLTDNPSDEIGTKVELIQLYLILIVHLIPAHIDLQCLVVWVENIF